MHPLSVAVIALVACSGGPTPSADEDGPGDDSSTDDSGDSGPASLELEWVTLHASGGAEGSDLAVAPDGTLYASWVASGHVWLVASEDAGETWSDPLYVNEGMGPPDTYQDSHPNLAVDADRVLVAMSGAGHQQLYTSDRDELNFGEPVVLELFNEGYQYEGIFLRAHLAADGEAWLSTHAFPEGSWNDGWKGLARESTGWVLDSASGGADGLPCECCPQELLFTSSGTSILAYRNNVDDLRDMTVALGSDGGLPDHWADVSSNDWEVTYCPVQGPRLDEAPDGTVHMVWSDGVGDSNEIYTVRSSDGGSSWTPVAQVLEDDEDQGRKSPDVAVGDDGTVLLSWSTSLKDSALAWSSDGGETWTLHGELLADGASLSWTEVASGPGFLGGIATDTDGRIQLFRVR